MTEPARNNLDRETSPYLLQHHDNPVHWQAWGTAALEQARISNKPILLSIGYAACHWCHVMAHESFEDPAIAAVMNDLFVSIKVDREERPDIDSIYQSALAMLGEQGGWPLTMFLTPDGSPFWGGTYFPPTARYGRPAFTDLLRKVAEVYHTDPATIAKNCDLLRDGLNKLAQPQGGEAPAMTSELQNRIAERLLQNVDPENGGIGGAPKFPQCSIMELLWRAWRRTGETPCKQAVTLTLDRMSQGGIYDHLGGGYARYSTDAVWLAPHFEKMLYDNAQLLDNLCLVHAETQSPLYEARIRETIAWVLREMIAEGGAFAATQDADSEGEEGKFYVWTEAEIDALLGNRAALFKNAYDVTPGGNWEGHTILNRSAQQLLGDEETEAELAGCRAILLAVRETRIKPGWDDKVLADWNGLMIASLAQAGLQFDEPEWIEAAARAFRFIQSHMIDGGRLRHAWRAGRLQHAALLDDYANLARGALALLEATGATAYLAQAEAWVTQLDRHYWDAEHGGYFFTADDAEALIARTRHAHDNAVPAGNSTMIGVLARLWYLTGKAGYRDRHDALIAAFAGEVTRNFFPLASFLNQVEFSHSAQQVVIIGERDEAATEALIRAAMSVSAPNRLLSVIAPGQPLPAGHPAQGKTQTDGQATAYLCIGTTCTMPITAPADLALALREG